MPFKDIFIQSLLPGNYALTKSMELTKVNDSGTLWYTKKYLTLYYYVFLSNEIFTTEYVTNITRDFRTFVDSIDESIRPLAETYFFPREESVNFSSARFKTFINFANRMEFASENEKRDYYNSAKKAYFAFLMGTGGQSGVKKEVVAAIRKTEFHYDHPVLNSIIFDAAIKTCVENGNSGKKIDSGDVPRILSKKAIDEIKELLSNGPITEAQARSIVNQFPCSEEYPGQYGVSSFTSPQYSGVESDCFASVRNERQILYYYGFFHSKSSGATDFEFSSLTPIGELALRANAKEFLAIWEHQKIKMISQPATADINNVPVVTNSAEAFAISYTPYTDILGHLLRRGRMTCEEYQYLISRKKHIFSEEEWQISEDRLCNDIQDVKDVVDTFGRIRDIKTEDSQKELKKYLLGIRSDLPVDAGTNSFNACRIQSSAVEVTNEGTVRLLYGLYTKLDKYKIERYKDIFTESENDLKERYIAARERRDNVAINPRVKIHWDLYNIHPDKLIMISTVLALEINQCNVYNLNDLTSEQINNITATAFNVYRSLLSDIGITSLAKFRKNINTAIRAFKNDDYSAFIPSANEEREEVIAEYREVATEDVRTRIRNISASAVVTPAEDRVRNMSLVSLLKSYYIQRFAHDGVLTCECCGQETFITERGEPYLEFHHLIPFGIAYGPDHYLNLFALCPNCHRKMHHLNITMKGAHYHLLDDNNYLQLGITERLRELKSHNLLRSYHLEYLLADQAITEEEYNLIAS